MRRRRNGIRRIDSIIRAGVILDITQIQLANIVYQILIDVAGGKAALGHLLDGLVLGPALHDDAVDGTHRPGAVDSLMAVYKDRRSVTIRDDLQ